MTSITPFNFNQGIGFGKNQKTNTQPKAKNWAQWLQNTDQETRDKILKAILEQNSVKTRTPEADYSTMNKHKK